MTVFEAVKENVTALQAAELYGMEISEKGMALCPFHPDRNPSLKLDDRFHCFGCHADGDVIDFVSRLFHMSAMEAAEKLADDFGIDYDGKEETVDRPHIREPTPEQRFQQIRRRTYQVLHEYYHLLSRWRRQYAPQKPGDPWSPLFTEALQKIDRLEYCLDILRYGTLEEQKDLIAEQKTEVEKIEQRISKWLGSRGVDD